MSHGRCDWGECFHVLSFSLDKWLIKAKAYRDVSLGFTRMELWCRLWRDYNSLTPQTLKTQTLHEMLEELFRFISTSSIPFRYFIATFSSWASSCKYCVKPRPLQIKYHSLFLLASHGHSLSPDHFRRRLVLISLRSRPMRVHDLFKPLRSRTIFLPHTHTRSCLGCRCHDSNKAGMPKRLVISQSTTLWALCWDEVWLC